jgi:hypothetical protein
MKKQITVGGKSITVTNEVTQNFEGTVVITDPCYYIPDEIWQSLCDDVWFDNGKTTAFTSAGTILIGNIKILYSSTAHGDGSYTVEGCTGITQKEFGVDSGVMSVITLDDFEKLSNDDPSTGLYAMAEDFDGTITASGNGNFGGDLEVITDGSNSGGWDGEGSDDDWDDEDDHWRNQDRKSEWSEDDDYDEDDY